jgi:sec-independent protein translocase protein TatB
MLDIAWPELIVIGAVALVAIGPKDLPKAMYTLGKWAGKARGFAHDIHRAFEQATYEAELSEKRKTTPRPEDFAPKAEVPPMTHDSPPVTPEPPSAGPAHE